MSRMSFTPLRGRERQKRVDRWTRCLVDRRLDAQETLEGQHDFMTSCAEFTDVHGAFGIR